MLTCKQKPEANNQPNLSPDTLNLDLSVLSPPKQAEAPNLVCVQLMSWLRDTNAESQVHATEQILGEQETMEVDTNNNTSHVSFAVT